MSEIVTTSVGRFRTVTDGARKWFLWECPSCLEWGTLSEDQWQGRVSVVCQGAQSRCRYHETHDYGKELVVTMQARILTGDAPIDSEV